MRIANLTTRLAHRLAQWSRRGPMRVAGAAIVAGGLVFAGQASAIEAVTNGSFEETSPVGWSGGFNTYRHADQIYYEGPAPVGAGTIYGWGPEQTTFGTATQTINLSQGISLIDAGTAAYDFNAWLAAWANDTDYTILELEWNDSTSGTGSTVGSVITFDGSDQTGPHIVGSADANGAPDPNVAWTLPNWTFHQDQATIPVGARSAVIRYQAQSNGGNGNDAYLDLVSLDLPFEVRPPTLEVFFDRDTGGIVIENNTGVAQDILGYKIESVDGSLIEENATFQADTDADWVQYTASGATGDLSEGILGAPTDTIANGGSVDLGDAWLKYYVDQADISFEYLDGTGAVIEGIVNFTGNGDKSFDFGDLDFDGDVDGQDWLMYADTLGSDMALGLSVAEAYQVGDFDNDGGNDHADFLAFKAGYDAVNGNGAFARMIASVPEPTSAILVMLGAACLFFRRSA